MDDGARDEGAIFQARFRALADEGRTAEEIAAAMNLRVKSVRRIAKNLCILLEPGETGRRGDKSGPSARSLAAETRALAAQGLTADEIAGRLQVPTHKVRYLARIGGVVIPRATKRRSPWKWSVQEMEDAIRQAGGLQGGADRLGVQKEVLSRRLRTHGLSARSILRQARYP